MNNFKFIARYAATAALIAGVSSQVAAFQECPPLDASCPAGVIGEVKVAADASFTYEATWGPGIIPDFQDVVLGGIDKFDRQFYADLEGVALDKITLVGVQVELLTEVRDMNVDLVNNLVACDFTWAYGARVTIQPNPEVLTPAINHDPIQFGDTILGLNAGDEYHWQLSDELTPPAQGFGCFTETTDLGPWQNNANTLSWDVELTAPRSDEGCSNSTQTYSNEGFVQVVVSYSYCVEGGDVPPTDCACLTPSPNYRNPGSLLLFPEFDNREGDVTVVTVTNTDCDGSAGGTNVDVEFIYIDANGCGEFNKTETLTPCDTLTLLTNYHNPNQERGYMYAFAKNDANESIVWNHLIGSLLVVSGLEAFDYGINPVVFRGIGSASGIVQSDGTTTDLDGDGNRDLDAREYDAAPNSITIPRFLGQDAPGDNASIRSQMILIALSGGVRFETNVCFLFWNDNEEVFSGEYNFSCWDKPFLDDMSMGFRNDFLKTTNHDPMEIVGAPQRESGWICIQGCQATSTQETIVNPAIYAVLVERVGSWGVADLPFECGTRINGALVPNSVFGDGDPTPVDGDNQ